MKSVFQKNIKSVLALLVLITGTFLSSCHIQSDITLCTVTFDSDGGSSVASKTVMAGETVSRPTDPTNEGFEFAGWYADAGLTNLFNFDSFIIANTVIYAKWDTVTPAVTTHNVTFELNGGTGCSNITYDV